MSETPSSRGFVRDPEGNLHLLGEIEESHDWTECRRQIRGVDGWHGAMQKDDEMVCRACVDADNSRAFPGIDVHAIDAGSLTIENNTFGRAGTTRDD